MQPGYGPPAAGERWNINMPAVIGVVFVFLVGVVVWVVASSGGGDGTGAASPTVAPAAPPPTSPVTPAPTLSPTPLPTTTRAADVVTTTTSPATTTAAPPTTTANPPSTTTATAITAAPTTTTGDSDSDTLTGDLDIPGRPMRRPPCDGGYITIVGSPVGEQATAEAVGAVLDQYSGTNYLRTDRSCPSLAQDLDGEPIYVIYFGPFVVASDACAARADGPDDAYARALSDELEPDHSVDCT